MLPFYSMYCLGFCISEVIMRLKDYYQKKKYRTRVDHLELQHSDFNPQVPCLTNITSNINNIYIQCMSN